MSGTASGVLSHSPIRDACLIRWGGACELVHDTFSQRKKSMSRSFVNDLEEDMAISYAEAFPRMRRLLIIEKKNLSRKADNCNKSALSKTLVTGKGKNCKQMVAVAGQEHHYDKDFLSHDPNRPSAFCRFDEDVVREFFEGFEGNATWEHAKKACRVTSAVLGKDTGGDPHIHEMLKVPPINMASSDRKLFEEKLVDNFNRDVGDLLKEHNIDPVCTWDPEFVLNTAAVAASDLSKVQTWIQYLAVWHAAMHMMKTGFALPDNVVYFWQKYFDGPVKYR